MSLRPTPSEQYLYVMQNEHGLIKVGRSIDPDRRRRSLQREHGCSIVLVAAVAATGHDEEKVHLLLERHRVGGEWFSGATEVMQTLIDTLNLDPALIWPYDGAATSKDLWVAELQDRQAQQYWARRRYRLIGCLKCAVAGLAPLDKMQNGSEALDIRIHRALDAQEHILALSNALMSINAKQAMRNETMGVVPAYTSDVRLANLLWPEHIREDLRRPTLGALDCCVSALCARWGLNEAAIGPRRGF